LRFAPTTLVVAIAMSLIVGGVLLTGGALIALGVLAIVDVFRRGDAKDAPVESDDAAKLDEHDEHGHHGPRSAWLLLPVLAIFLIAPPALGYYAAARDLTNSSPTAAVAPPLPDGDPVEVYLSDYVNRAVWDAGRTLESRTVAITGLVVPDPDSGWWLTRMSLACCAADAFAGKIQIVDPPEGWESPSAVRVRMSFHACADGVYGLVNCAVPNVADNT